MRSIICAAAASTRGARGTRIASAPPRAKTSAARILLRGVLMRVVAATRASTATTTATAYVVLHQPLCTPCHVLGLNNPTLRRQPINQSSLTENSTILHTLHATVPNEAQISASRTEDITFLRLLASFHRPTASRSNVTFPKITSDSLFSDVALASAFQPSRTRYQKSATVFLCALLFCISIFCFLPQMSDFNTT